MAASATGKIAFSVFLLAACGAQANDRIHDARKAPAVSIASPSQGFATNAATLQVDVAFDLRHARHQDDHVTQLRLWLHGRLADTQDIPRRVEKGVRRFALDVSARPEGSTRVHADLVRVKRDKGHAKDRRGKEHVHVLDVSRPVAGILDRTPPSLRIVSPADRQIVGETTVSVHGFATDNLAGIATLTLNGGTLPVVAGGSFSATINLPFGINTLHLTATDRAGNSATSEHHVLHTAQAVFQPAILAIPPAVALVGTPLQYEAAAASINPERLEYSLAAAPPGMAIDARSGLLSWTPGADQVGEHPVSIKARDADGETSQSFRLSVFGRRPVASARISASAGGVLSVDDPASSIHGLSIAIPANALLEDTTIQVSEVLTPPTLAGTPRFFLKGVVIEPDALLSAPATIRLPYDASQFRKGHGIALESFLTAYFADPRSGSLEGLASFAADTAGQAIVGTVPHFSVYAFANGARLCPPPRPGADCPDTIDVAPEKSIHPTALMVHGFQPGGLGSESTWGELRTLLGRLDAGARGRVDAWRFDWDSASRPFERSAVDLAEAIARIRDRKQSELEGLNVVAHSFGGLLVRTYLQGRADFGGRAYREGDINKVLTIGTPHQGIGGPYSTFYADRCASLSGGPLRFTTCTQVNSGAPRQPSDGSLIRSLTPVLLPVPVHTIVGQLLGGIDRARLIGFVEDHDGLITAAGAALPEAATSETLALGNADSLGLCHSSVLFEPLGSCVRVFGNGQRNIAMAEIGDKSHALWPKVCRFLGAGERECKPLVTVFRTLGGSVTSVPQGVDCGAVCSVGYDAGTDVILTAGALSGYKFDGWSGACTGTQAQCVFTTDQNDKSVIATFTEVTGGPVQYTSSQLSLPEAPTSIGFTGIAFNTSGDIVWPVRPRDSYLRANGGLFRFTVAGETITQAQALGINDRREIVGVLCDPALEAPSPSGGVVDSCRIFFTSVADVLAAPEEGGIRTIVPSKVLLPQSNAYWFNPNGINNNADVVGFYQPAPEADDTGFLLTGAGTFVSFKPGGARFSYPSGLNDGRDSVGYACPHSGPCGPFLRRGDGSAGEVPVPIRSDAEYAGINNAGLIVGNYGSGTSASGAPGFLVSGSTLIDLPAFGEATRFLGINNAGQLLGSNSQGHFIATPRP